MTRSDTPILELAPAKINLYLHIEAKLNNGMHSIDSLIMFADCADQVFVTPQKNITLDRYGPMSANLPAVPDDQVYKAAQKLAVLTNNKAGAKIIVKKNLPIAGGLGGGTADAAAVIRALGKLWRVDISDDLKRNLAKELGADFHVCLENKSSRVKGIGDELLPLKVPHDLSAVLVNPLKTLMTVEVFSVFRKEVHINQTLDIPSSWSDDSREFIRQIKELRNDLTDPAISLCPIISEVLLKLGSSDGCMLQRMSGSGATCFGLFVDHERAVNAAEKIRSNNLDWWVTTTKLNSKHV
jgi:4-diphosphocytidyl-2-C-methyl-D-erythritol kinase